MSTTSLQNHPSVKELFNHVDTIPLGHCLDERILPSSYLYSDILWLARTVKRIRGNAAYSAVAGPICVVGQDRNRHGRSNCWNSLIWLN